MKVCFGEWGVRGLARMDSGPLKGDGDEWRFVRGVFSTPSSTRFRIDQDELFRPSVYRVL